MTNTTPSTASEKKLNKAIQASVDAVQDGILGPATAVDLAVKVGAECWPLTIKLYQMPVIVCRDIAAFNPAKGCKHFANSLSGSFSYQKKPCSILVNDGDVIFPSACHAFLDKPESVLYRLHTGAFGVKRCRSTAELPAGVKWAVGGMGLLAFYDPAAEGFSGDYADVLRKTNHTVLGEKNGMVYLVYCRSMTGAEVNAFCRDKLGLRFAVMLDGGHVAAINGEESFARINTSQTQYYMLQGK